MSTKQWLKERSGPRARVRDVDRVPSGSPARLRLRLEPGIAPNTPKAAAALARRHVPLARAHAAMTRLIRDGAAAIEAPRVESLEALVDELAQAGVRATRQAPLPVPNVRAIRERLGMGQEEFALEFGLDVASVRNWEQGRAEPDTATRTMLLTIALRPDAVRAALDHQEDEEAAWALAT
jgi:DNA-binding transcriptional regulator YiaG